MNSRRRASAFCFWVTSNSSSTTPKTAPSDLTGLAAARYSPSVRATFSSAFSPVRAFSTSAEMAAFRLATPKSAPKQLGVISSSRVAAGLMLSTVPLLFISTRPSLKERVTALNSFCFCRSS